jgi:hypothetical protein
MRSAVIILSSLFTVAATIPYLIEIVRGQTKPRVVTWFTWAIILSIGSAAAFTAHQIPAGVLMLSTSLEAAAVVVLGYKHGDRTFEKLDLICLCGAVTGLSLWMLLHSPALAVLATVLIDFTGALPTLKHSWHKPHEETLITYVLFSISNVLTLTVVNYRVFTSLAYPIYVFSIDLAIALFIFASPHRELPVIAAELLSESSPDDIADVA